MLSIHPGNSHKDGSMHEGSLTASSREFLHDQPTILEATIVEDLYDFGNIPVASPIELPSVKGAQGSLDDNKQRPNHKPQRDRYFRKEGHQDNLVEAQVIGFGQNTCDQRPTPHEASSSIPGMNSATSILTSASHSTSRDFQMRYQFNKGSEDRTSSTKSGSWGEREAGNRVTGPLISNQEPKPRPPNLPSRRKPYGRSVSFSDSVTVFVGDEGPKRQLSRLIPIKSGDYSFLLEAVGNEYADLEVKNSKSDMKESWESIKKSMEHDANRTRMKNGVVRGHRSSIS